MPLAFKRATKKDNSDIHEARAVIQMFLDAVHGLDAHKVIRKKVRSWLIQA